MLYELGRHQIELPGKWPSGIENARLILWHNGKVLVSNHDISIPLIDENIDSNELEFIGLLNGKAYFAAEQVVEPSNPEQWLTLREVAFIGETQFMLCARARGLLEWRRQHRFCGQCGQLTTRVKNEPAMACQPCRLRFYPRISPCIIVLITQGRSVLLAQGERQKERGWFSTLAGFIETGESAEQAVIREVKEEVNVEIKNIQYLNSQAWPFPNQLMLGFHAEYKAGDIIPAPGEIADARWFSIDDLPKHPPSISIAGWLIRQYVDQFME